jgi:hypothetical protein
MTSCESSANTSEPLANPQVAVRRTPLKTDMLCETVLTDCRGGSDAQSSRNRGRTKQLSEVRSPGGQYLPHPGRKVRDEVPHRPLHPRARAPRGAGSDRAGGPRPRAAVEGRPARRGTAGRRGGQADPDRLRPLLDRPARTRLPARRARTGLQADLLREDLHPDQDPARAGEGAEAGVRHQGGRPRALPATGTTLLPKRRPPPRPSPRAWMAWSGKSSPPKSTSARSPATRAERSPSAMSSCAPPDASQTELRL